MADEPCRGDDLLRLSETLEARGHLYTAAEVRRDGLLVQSIDKARERIFDATRWLFDAVAAGNDDAIKQTENERIDAYRWIDSIFKYGKGVKND